MKRRVDLSTEEIQEIFECVNEHERKELAEFLIGGNAVLTSGEAVGEHSFYGVAVAAVIDKDFSDYLPYARSLIVWIGSDSESALKDLQWLFAAIFRKTSGYCHTAVMITDKKSYEDRAKVVIVAK